jgi:hypothetical protein
MKKTTLLAAMPVLIALGFSCASYEIDTNKDKSYTTQLSKVLVIMYLPDLTVRPSKTDDSKPAGEEARPLAEYLRDKLSAFFNQKGIASRFVIKGKLDLDDSATENAVKEFAPRNIFYISRGPAYTYYTYSYSPYPSMPTMHIAYPLEFTITDTEQNKNVWRAATIDKSAKTKSSVEGLDMITSAGLADLVVELLQGALETDGLVQ